MALSPPPFAVVVAMKGHPGTGKTTLARAVAATLRCPLLDKDDVRDCTLPVQQSLPASAASSLLNDLSYGVLWRLTETQLRLGLSVVVDSPLSRRAHLDRLLEVAARVGGARVVVVECQPGDEDEWRRRLEGRPAAAAAAAAGGGAGVGWHKPATWGALRELVEGYGGCSHYDLGGVPRLVVDTTAASAGMGDLVASVVEFVNSNAGAGGGDPNQSGRDPVINLWGTDRMCTTHY